MDDPPELASAFLSAGAAGAEAGVGFLQEREQYQALEEGRTLAYERTARAARGALLSDYTAIADRFREERESGAQEIAQLKRDAQIAGGQAMVNAAARGIGGGSVADIHEDYEQQALQGMSIVNLNIHFLRRELDREALNSRARAMQSIFDAQGPILARPDAISPILKFTTAGLKGGFPSGKDKK